MANKKNINTNKVLATSCISLFDDIHGTTSLATKFYENKCEILSKQIIEMEEREPLKIFKKNHKLWSDELKKLQRDYDNTSEKLMNEYKEYEAQMNLYYD